MGFLTSIRIAIASVSITALLTMPALAQKVSSVGAAAYTASTISPLTQQYLTMRHASPPQKGLTLQVLAEDPAAYRGKTVEIEGKLTGILSADEGLTRLMVTTDTAGTISLTMSRLPDWLRSGERLRVLVVVVGSDDPDTVEMGIPEMEVVAVASAWEVTALEKKERERQNAVATANAKRAAQVAAARNRRSSSSLTSRYISRASSTLYKAAATSVATNGLSASAQNVYIAYRDFIWNWNRRLTERQANDIAGAVLRYSEAMDTDPRLVIALIIAESDFDPNSTSHAGAMGLGQLMPDEAKDLNKKFGLTNPYDPVQNIAGSVYLLRSHLNKYSGGKAMSNIGAQEITLALAAYNAGPGAVRKYGGVPPYRETQNYVRKIAAIYKQLCGKAG